MKIGGIPFLVVVVALGFTAWGCAIAILLGKGAWLEAAGLAVVAVVVFGLIRWLVFRGR